MKAMDFFLPVQELDASRVTEQIIKTYNDFSDIPISAEKKLKALLGIGLWYGIFFALSWCILRMAENFSLPYVWLYIFLFVASALVFVYIILGGVTNKTWSACFQIVPPITLFVSLAGFLLLFGPAKMQTSTFVAVYYGVLLFYGLSTFAMYRADYKKFPEIAYRNSSKKKSKWWLGLLMLHLIGVWAARTIPYGVLGVGMMMFVQYLCHFESFLLIIARYQPQIMKIGKSRGY